MPHRPSARQAFERIIGSGGISRRQFVHRLVGSGVMLGLSGGVLTAERSQPVNKNQQLTGRKFDLVIEQMPVNITGRPAMAIAINGSIPAPTLHWQEGEEVVVRVLNRLSEPTSLHWHGILLPYQMDGVPGISFSGITPGATFTYRFRVQQSGTYWYHAHSGFQEMSGLYGAIVIAPRSNGEIPTERDYVVQLSEWTDEDPMALFRKLKSKGHYYNFNQPTLPEFLADVRSLGFGGARERREMWNTMRMKPTDLGDLSASALTFLMNGLTSADNYTAPFRAGERVRLRFINAAGNTFFDLRIPGVPMTVVQADGINVEPVEVDEFRIAPGETYDVIVEPHSGTHAIFAESMERSGFVCGSLTSEPGARADIPATRPAEWLSITDMMGAMAMGDAAAGHSAHVANEDLAENNPLVRHASSEFGASTDMRVDMPRTNLDDPGIGLRNNGRRVLTLADLRSAAAIPDVREPAREIELHLTGNMERYSWSIDGLEYGKSTPVHFRHGERLRVTLHNDTMMTHPMHLHGMWSDLEDARGNLLARRHTLVVQPAQRLSFRVTADALGRWAWHCHLLFHMDAGMFREVVVA